MEGLDWQLLHVPLAAGLMQRADDRARPTPFLDRAVDVAFDESGGIQTRKPFGAAFGALTNARRVVDNGEELLVFTKDELYSWSPATGEMVSRGTHLAAAIDEETVFADTRDSACCDRAELDGVVVFVSDVLAEGAVHVCARSKTTGTVIVAAHEIAFGFRPRLVALETSILLFWQDSDAQDFNVLAIDPADVATSLAATPTAILSGTAPGTVYYDVERVPGADQAVMAYSLSANTTRYIMHVVDADAALVDSSTKNRTSYGPLAVTCTPDGATVLVVHTDNSSGDHDVLGDLITISGLADTAQVDKAIGTTPSGAGNTPQQIAAVFLSSQVGSEYRAVVFWHYYIETTSLILGAWSTQKNTIDTDGTLGTAAVFANRLAVCSRAFEREDHAYVHLAYAEPAGVRSPILPSQYKAGPALQNTAFLYRDDGHRVAKIAPGRLGGYVARRGILPGVVLVDDDVYAWCATERRIVPTEHEQTYTDRGPRDVLISFDDDRARRCVRLGSTLYVTGGELLAYDGVALVEVGWPILPSDMTFAQGNAAGDLAAGTYAYRPSWAFRNAKGELDRSSTAVVGEFAISGATPNSTQLTVGVLTVTRKARVAVEVWRSEVNPTFDAPFFLITSPNPADTGSSLNSYEVNDPTAAWSGVAMEDGLEDDDITDLAAHPTAGTANLEYLAPPACAIMVAGEARLLLAGVPNDPDRIFYSRQRQADEVASFHPSLVAEVPPAGGDITALAFLLDTLVVFRESAIYALGNDGRDNTGGGQNYGPARCVASDVGAVNQESVCLMPQGLLFKSSKGWYLLNRGWSVEYVGAAVKDYDTETPLAVTLLENVHEVRILTASRMLVWDYAAQQWGERSISDGVHACVWRGTYYYLTATGPRAEVAHGAASTGYGLDVETTWIKPADIQGFARVRKLQLLGEYRSSDLTHLRIRIAYNYSDTYVDDTYWPVSPTTIGGPLQVKIGPSRQQVQAIKIRITAILRTTVVPEVGPPVITNGPPTGEALKLTSLALEIGLKRGAYPRLPAAQRS